MKQTHLVVLLIMAVGVFIIVSTADNASEYLSFDDIKAKIQTGDDQKFHVVGVLPRNSDGQVVDLEYQPTIDPNYLAFNLIDEQGVRQKVVSYNPPAGMQDFTRSEKVVIVGTFKNNVFVADNILLKCPSKYETTDLKSAY